MSTAAPGAGATPAPTRIEVEIERPDRDDDRIRVTDISPGGAASISADRVILPGDVCELCGWRIIEATGAAAAGFELFDGSSAGGALLGAGWLAASGNDTLPIARPGIVVNTGRVFIHVVSGSLVGVLYWR